MSKENHQEENYYGNIWGWKFSLAGLVVISLLTFIFIYRQFVLGIPPFEENAKTEVVRDTAKTVQQ